MAAIHRSKESKGEEFRGGTRLSFILETLDSLEFQQLD